MPIFILTKRFLSQLLWITHEMHKIFDCNPPISVRETFLDISKAFNNVSIQYFNMVSKIYYWNSIRGGVSHHRWIISNSQTFSWKNICPGVPQGSVLEPLLFLIHKNKLPDGMELIFTDNIRHFLLWMMANSHRVPWIKIQKA